MIRLQVGDLVAIASQALGVNVEEVLDEMDPHAAGDAVQPEEGDAVPTAAARVLVRLLTRPPLPRAAGRLAVLATLQFLGLNGLRLVGGADLGPVVERVRRGEAALGEVAGWISGHTVAVEPDDDEVLRSYLADIEQYPLLSREEEARLARSAEAARRAQEEIDANGTEPGRRKELEETVQEGMAARRRLVQSNLRLVVPIAEASASAAADRPILDLIQHGNLGLMEAVDRYDWRKGFRFSTYARWWIREAITRATTAG